MTLSTIVYISASFFIGFIGLICGMAILSGARKKTSNENIILSERIAQHERIIASIEEKNNVLMNENQQVKENLARQQAEKESYIRQIEENKNELKKMEDMMISRFENLSNKIFEEKTEKFKTQSQQSLNELLSPLREKLGNFEKKVNDSFGDQAKEQFSLKEQIKNIVEVNEKMTLQAEGLANALKGDSKAQGDWGEIVLEKILEDSGLRKDHDYTVQGSGMNLRDADGILQKPDVIVNLPDNKHVIIDSKVSLTHYERHFAQDDDTVSTTHLSQFISSVKKHICDLEQRRYQDTEKLGTPDFVLMFIPIEAAYILAIQEDKEIQNYAWNKKVVLVCPTTLFATLKTIASVWRLELQNKNAQEIAKQGGQLYEKMHGFVEDMQALGRQMGTVQKTYDAAMTKMSQGKGNILGRTEKLKTLGAKTSKSLPRELLDTNAEDSDHGAQLLDIEREQEKRQA